MEIAKKNKLSENTLKSAWTSILVSVIGILASSISIILPMIKDVKAQQPRVIGIILFFVISLTVAELTTYFLRRGPSRVALLKSKLRGAYLGSLDASGLNPAHMREK